MAAVSGSCYHSKPASPWSPTASEAFPRRGIRWPSGDFQGLSAFGEDYGGKSEPIPERTGEFGGFYGPPQGNQGVVADAQTALL